MLLNIFLLTLGFVLLIFSANWLVDGSSLLAKKYNVSDIAIGLTIVAFGTSAPELIVSILATINNNTDVCFGNVIGSNLFNLLAILGIAGMVYPLTVKTNTVWKEIPLSLLAAIILLFLANNFFIKTDTDLYIGRIDGIVLLIFFGLFLWYVYTQMKVDVLEDEVKLKPKPMYIILGMILFGLAGLFFGGKLVVNNAVDIATRLNISEKIIGLTIVAAGTSLPELMTSVVAAFKKKSDIAVGNIIGSNIFNIFLILGVSSLIKPLHYNKMFNIDLAILSAGTVLLFFAMFTGVRKKLDRWEAGVLFILYVLYCVYLIMGEM